MRIQKRYLVLVTVACGIILLVWYFLVPTQLDYRGEKFKVSRRLQVAGFLVRPERILSSEAERAQKLILDAPIAPTFKSRDEIDNAVAAIMFPSSEIAVYGEQTQTDGSKIAMWSVEVPRFNEDRFLVFQKKAGGYKLVDDFELGRFKGWNAGDGWVIRVSLESGQIEYRSSDGTLLHETQL